MNSGRATDKERRMKLGGHLRELRKRLIWVASGVIAASIGGWILSEPVLEAMSIPIGEIVRTQGRSAELNFTNISEAFDLRLQIAVTVGVVLASPVWLYQIWAFLVPGLTQRERRYSVGFVAASVPLFVLGCAAGWMVLPNMVHLLTAFAPEGSSAMISAKGYYDFVLKLVIAIGVAFVLPVFLVLLNLLGILSAKSILRSWRGAIVLIVLFTAIATPAADFLSMFVLAVPMIGLYFLAAGIAWIHDRKAFKRVQKLDMDLASL